MSEDEMALVLGRSIKRRKVLEEQIAHLESDIRSRQEFAADTIGLVATLLKDPTQKSAAGEHPFADDVRRQLNTLDLPSIGVLCIDLFKAASELKRVQSEIDRMM